MPACPLCSDCLAEDASHLPHSRPSGVKTKTVPRPPSSSLKILAIPRCFRRLIQRDTATCLWAYLLSPTTERLKGWVPFSSPHSEVKTSSTSTAPPRRQHKSRISRCKPESPLAMIFPLNHYNEGARVTGNGVKFPVKFPVRGTRAPGQASQGIYPPSRRLWTRCKRASTGQNIIGWRSESTS
jgi:hypothetical protein